MAPEAVQPLRINKMPASGVPRPLSEISPMGVRRNSPSFNQTTGKPSTGGAGQSSSPFDHSSVNTSPRLFWKSRDADSPSQRDSENSPLRHGASSPVRRTSLEKLKNASRVTNSHMFAREHDSDYDPDSSLVVDRPLATNRPLSQQVQGNAWMGTGLEDKRNDAPPSGHRRTQSNVNIPTLLRSNSPSNPGSPSKLQQSPQKSSLSSNIRYAATDMFDPEEGTWSGDEASTRANTPRALRQAKSVTFDNAPPQINEYEMITPDPSSIASGSREGSYDSEPFDMDDAFERPDSSDREDSFDDSLEDADKTPVVLPEDWRFMSPEAANTGLAASFDDPFDVASPSTRYRPTPEREMAVARSSSINSNGDRRPLPPLPPWEMGHRRISSKESISKSSLSISTPPRPASVSKAEILGMRSSPIPLEERLRLLSVEKIAQSRAEHAQRLEKASSPLHSSPQVGKEKDKSVQRPSQSGTGESVAPDYKPPPRVSRESILKTLKPQNLEELRYEDSSPAANRSVSREEIDYLNLDPDVPIPSRETSSIYGDDTLRMPVKQEDSDDGSLVDMYASPESEVVLRSVSPVDDNGIESSVIHYDFPHSDTPDSDDETPVVQGMSDSSRVGTHNDVAGELSNAEVVTPIVRASDAKIDSSRMSLPEFTSIFSKDDFDFGLESYLTPTSQKEATFEPEKKTIPLQETSGSVTSQPSSLPAFEWAKAAPDISKRPSTPVEIIKPDFQISQDLVERGASTPESVIHHPVEEEEEDSSYKSSPTVPEPVATIKAPGSKLKTRLSATPADLKMMSATRRQISGAQPAPIVEHEKLQMSDAGVAESHATESTGHEESAFLTESSRPSLNVQLDVALLGNGDLGLGVGEEFDRLLEAKKKGYLMRQNTNVVVASNRQLAEDYSVGAGPAAVTSTAKAESQGEEAGGSRSAGNSPRKISKTWTTEPWNGRMRRHSTRRSNIVPEKRLPAGPAPPMPGQESNVTEAMETVIEDQTESAFDDSDGSGERGRVFVKVVGVKELDLPLPKNERCHFQMTLDNGLHCVTTSWADLGRNAPIGQEFELVVFDDLEFQLTLQTRLERPQSATQSVQSFTPSLNPKKPSALSRMFTSPKKRREQEKKQRDEEAQAAIQRDHDLESLRSIREPTAWDLQNELVGPDGSFARAYVCLSNYERQAYGRPYTVDVPCWNEWAVEDKSIASTRSKNGGVQRKPPYRIGKMELQLLYVPRPRNAVEEDMPKSMSAAARLLREAEAAATRKIEGHLSQQGGDCPYWRRRFFKLNGSKLTAYHDMTRQPRATISLAKATKLIDDRSSLTQPDPTSAVKSKNRRKSAFAEEEEGYMFVEEGFRIRFANGEVIDFYADNSAEKNRWMRVLSEVVGKEGPEEKITWMSMVQAKERAAATAAAKSSGATKGGNLKDSNIPFRNTSKSVPTSPQKPQITNPGTKSQAATNGIGLHENKQGPVEKTSRNMNPPSLTSTTKTPAKTSTSPAKASNSPTKASTSPTKASTTTPAKQKIPSPVKEHKSPSKRNSANIVPSPSPRKQNKDVAGKRQAVRSMIF